MDTCYTSLRDSFMSQAANHTNVWSQPSDRQCVHVPINCTIHASHCMIHQCYYTLCAICCYLCSRDVISFLLLQVLGLVMFLFIAWLCAALLLTVPVTSLTLLHVLYHDIGIDMINLRNYGKNVVVVVLIGSQ